MPNKSCGNCKHCIKMISMREGAEPLLICHELYGDVEGINVTPPYDKACELWEEDER